MNDVIVEAPRAPRAAAPKRRSLRPKVLVAGVLSLVAPVVVAGQAWANGCCCG
jgi:hypothetical protein